MARRLQYLGFDLLFHNYSSVVDPWLGAALSICSGLVYPCEFTNKHGNKFIKLAFGYFTVQVGECARRAPI